MSEIIHASSAPDGSVLMFPFSACYFLKVCDPYTGKGGVVELFKGAYYSIPEGLEKRGLGVYCKVTHKDIDALYGINEEDN